jgi:hypothetical protein
MPELHLSAQLGAVQSQWQQDQIAGAPALCPSSLPLACLQDRRHFADCCHHCLPCLKQPLHQLLLLMPPQVVVLACLPASAASSAQTWVCCAAAWQLSVALLVRAHLYQRLLLAAATTVWAAAAAHSCRHPCQLASAAGRLGVASWECGLPCCSLASCWGSTV